MALLVFFVLAVLFTSKDDYMGKICTVIIVFAVLWIETPLIGIIFDVISFVFGIISGFF